MESPRQTSVRMGAQDVIVRVVPPPEEGSLGLRAETSGVDNVSARGCWHDILKENVFHTSYVLNNSGEHVS